jgi:ubiquinone/menaquinone biosynthesis C-methylase UbiE
LSVDSPEFTQATYDKVADAYDDLWSGNVREPNARLTRALDLKPGERVADLACGTGLFTVAMAKAVAPGEVVGVDVSEGMLAAAQKRAEAHWLSLTLDQDKIEDFVAAAPPASFDVVSVRFALAYIDWDHVFPRIGAMVRPGGRVGVLTNTTASVPQFYKLFDQYRGSFDVAWKLFKHFRKSFGEAWKIYWQLRDTFGDGRFVSVPDSAETVAERLARGGLHATDTWTDRIRLWFKSGEEAVDWMEESGFATHPTLQHVSPDTMRFLEALFAEGLEGFREPQGIPLDFVIAGVVARK